MLKEKLIKINDYLWEIPRGTKPEMRTSAKIYATEEMLDAIIDDESLDQIINVTTLPGIVGSALAMPDVHEGYGFPVGGVAAFDLEKGIISPGGIGYDINCGVRLLKSNVTYDDIKEKLEELGYALFREIPSGVGQGGQLKLSDKELDNILENGAAEIVKMGFGREEDLENIESNGRLENADTSAVSPRAKKRGLDQIGTLGAGNHFVEVQRIGTIFDEDEAEKLGIFKGQIVIMIHTGSRGLGHQIATDYIKKMVSATQKYNIFLPDRELACTPFKSEEGQQYFNAMAAGANYAWANRQMITHQVREAWKKALGKDSGVLSLVYDVAHNLAKVEKHLIDEVEREVVLHRKGATRAFPGEPVLIPGSMGTASYLLIGEGSSMKESFGSTCHGAGRQMSRTKARKEVSGFDLKTKLAQEGIIIMTDSMRGLAEEAPLAYKDVHNVVDVVDRAGIAKKVAEMKPLVVIKG